MQSHTTSYNTYSHKVPQIRIVLIYLSPKNFSNQEAFAVCLINVSVGAACPDAVCSNAVRQTLGTGWTRTEVRLCLFHMRGCTLITSSGGGICRIMTDDRWQGGEGYFQEAMKSATFSLNQKLNTEVIIFSNGWVGILMKSNSLIWWYLKHFCDYPLHE